MEPIPVVFHIGPLQIHTYGIGLAITFWVALRYFERRLRRAGYPTEWVTGVFVWVVVAAIVGARTLHVVTNLDLYQSHPVDVLAIWHGGLSSFGGLLGGIPVGFALARRRCPQLPLGQLVDFVAPVLVAAWALGRLLGPQLMIAGGGHPTNAWFGMYYSGQAGKRLPVPIFQAIDDTVIWLILLQVERRLRPRPIGLVSLLAVALWGLARFFEEHLWLGGTGHLGSVLVQVAGLALFALGLIGALVVWRRGPPVFDPLAPTSDTPPGSDEPAQAEEALSPAAVGATSDGPGPEEPSDATVGERTDPPPIGPMPGRAST